MSEAAPDTAGAALAAGAAGTPEASGAELVRLIGVQPDVVRSICTFNQNPADYIDDTRRREFFPARLGGALWECARSRGHLSRLILERIGAPPPCLETHRPEWPLVLLDRPRIDRLARHVAAALVGARVRRCLSRTEVLAWRDWLSPEAHEFALKLAGLLPFTADAGANARAMSAQHLGHTWIVSASRRWPPSITRRFILKLPAGAFAEADALDDALASRLVSSVLSNMEPRWCSSFATMRG